MSEALLDVRGLSKTFAGGVRAVQDVSFAVESGEILGLVGESGSGKSTLGRSLLRLIEPSSGAVIFKGRDIVGLGRSEMRGLREALRGVFVFPDTNAHGQGENPCWLYTVRFSARELWGDAADPSASVAIDAFEPYLDPA